MLFSCSGGQAPSGKTNETDNDSLSGTSATVMRTSSDLLWSRTELVGDAGSGNYFDLLRLCTVPSTNKTRHDNMLIVTSYFYSSACPVYRGNIKISNDTIMLALEPKTKISCAHQVFFRVTYVINNTSNKEFVLVKKQTPVDY